MDLIDFSAACFLVQPVDVLRHHCIQPAQLLELRQILVGIVRLNGPRVHLLTVELIVDLRFIDQTAVAQKVFRTILVKADIPLIVQSVLAPEIRHAAFRGDSCAAEKHNMLRVLDLFLQLQNLSFIHGHLLLSSPVTGYDFRPGPVFSSSLS